jgi:hypothetical protein
MYSALIPSLGNAVIKFEPALPAHAYSKMNITDKPPPSDL